jgi:hypothetical protein
MKRAWIGAAIVVLVVAVGAGAFWAGMTYGKSQAEQDVMGLIQERMGARGGRVPGQGMFPQEGQGDAPQFGSGMMGAMGTMGTMGTIEGVEGETLVINSAEGIIRVQTTDTTMIQKNMPVGVGDLEVGEAVVVSGPKNDDGSITARSVMSVGAVRFGQPSGGE